MEWKLVLLGNHDEAVVKSSSTYSFNAQAKKAVAWTQEQLAPGFLSAKEKKDRWQFLGGLRLKHEEDGVTFVHASPREFYHNTEYILSEDTFDLLGEVPKKIIDVFIKIKKLCFVGHSHFPGVLTENAEYMEPKDFNHKFTFENGKKYLINVGSIGQPRDSDIRACYVTFDGNGVTFHRVEYDHKKTQEKIFSIPSLDKRSGERLAVGM